MLRHTIYHSRENNKIHRFVFNEDLTNQKLEFAIKPDRNPGTRYIPKSYIPEGYSNGIFVSYNPASNTSLVDITIYRADTILLTNPQYLYTINKIDPDDPEALVTIASGVFELELTPLTSFDNTTANEAPEYADQIISKKLVALINSDGSGRKMRDAGFNTTLGFERISTSLYKITSSTDMFDDNLLIDFKPIAPFGGIQGGYQSRYLFGWQYTTPKILFIQVTDFMQGPVDLSFHLICERIRL